MMCIKSGVYQDCSDILYQHNRTTFTSCEILQELYSNSLWHSSSSSSSSSSCCCFILFDCQEYNQDIIPIILLLSSCKCKSLHKMHRKILHNSCSCLVDRNRYYYMYMSQDERESKPPPMMIWHTNIIVPPFT